MLHYIEHILFKINVTNETLGMWAKDIYIPVIALPILELQDWVKILLSVLKLVIVHLII